MSSNLATLGYPQIDKICDAKFVKNATGFKVKKDLVSFVEHSEKTQVYFDIKEKEIKNNLAIHQQDLRDFFKTMETDMTAHKKKAKELEQNKEKMAYNELKKKIIAEWQQEEADKKKAAELEAKIQAKIAQKGGQNVSGGSILGCESTISGTKKISLKKSLTTSHSIISPTPITQKTIQAISPKPVQSISKSTPKRVTPQKKSSLSVKKSSAHTAATHTATTHTATDHTATTSSLPQSLSDLTSSSDSEEETEQLTHHIDEETLYEEEKELSSETEEDSLDVTLAEMKLTLEDYHQIAQQMATAGRLEVVSTSMKPLAIQCVIFDESTQKIRFIVKN